MVTIKDIRLEMAKQALDLFGFEYVKNHMNDFAQSISEPIDGEIWCFWGFESDREKNRWTEFIHVAVNQKQGTSRLLDYRLPDGTRMENPIVPVRLSM